jgi:hypothetical protein
MWAKGDEIGQLTDERERILPDQLDRLPAIEFAKVQLNILHEA